MWQFQWWFLLLVSYSLLQRKQFKLFISLASTNNPKNFPYINPLSIFYSLQTIFKYILPMSSSSNGTVESEVQDPQSMCVTYQSKNKKRVLSMFFHFSISFTWFSLFHTSTVKVERIIWSFFNISRSQVCQSLMLKQ